MNVSGRTLVITLLAALVLGASFAHAWTFLGPESCQSCHPDAYAAWSASAHARSMQALSLRQQKDGRCVSCHAPNLAEAQVSAVTCESCHGSGQWYSPRYVMKDPELSRLVGLVDPNEKSCRGCHDASVPSMRPFDFPAALKAIDHWTIERNKRKVAGRP